MPQKQQAKKELRKSAKRAAFNLKIREDLKTLIKKAKQAIEAKQAKDKIEEMLKKAQKLADKAVQKKIIKKNTGARRVSRLYSAYKKSLQSKDSKAEVKTAVSQKTTE